MIDGKYGIVLAEDNPGDVFLVRTALQDSGVAFELEVLEDGAEVLRYFDLLEGEGRGAPDLLLLDLNLPKCSGEEILGALRAKPALKAMPVIVLTSSAHPKDREVALAMGVEQYFTKPADYDAFMRIGDLVKRALTPPAR